MGPFFFAGKLWKSVELFHTLTQLMVDNLGVWFAILGHDAQLINNGTQ
jgi:hypothetical protein